jgi:hypothetical protein
LIPIPPKPQRPTINTAHKKSGYSKLSGRFPVLSCKIAFREKDTGLQEELFFTIQLAF